MWWEKEFISILFLSIFIYGIILDKALTLRLALLIISFRYSVKLSCESILIPSFFTFTIFYFNFPNSYRSLVFTTCQKVAFITVSFHLVVTWFSNNLCSKKPRIDLCGTLNTILRIYCNFISSQELAYFLFVR